MEVYEKINLLIQEKKLSKKDFSDKLRNLEPKLNSTLEIPSEKSIYAYLNGRIGIKIELIPYIAEVLEIPEQLLFDDSSRTRKIYLKHILLLCAVSYISIWTIRMWQKSWRWIFLFIYGKTERHFRSSFRSKPICSKRRKISA